MQRRSLKRAAAAVALAFLTFTLAGASHADEWYPGLPDPVDTGAWANTAQGGMSYAGKTKQYVRMPEAMITSTQRVLTTPVSPALSRYEVFALAYFVSPESAPENYGYMEPVTIRTVGFGLMPVEATVQVSQRRENGYPVPISVHLQSVYNKDPQTFKYINWVADPVVVDDRFNVEITNIKVDGHDLNLRPGCRAAQPAAVKMVGPGYTIQPLPMGESGWEDWHEAADPSTFFHPLYGGQMHGTITMPAFTGCITSTGDDLSDMITQSVAGSDNKVTAQALGPCTHTIPGENTPWPLAKGKNTPKRSECPTRPPLPYPSAPPAD